VYFVTWWWLFGATYRSKKYRHNNIIKHAIIAKMKKIFNSEKEEDRISFAENK